MATFSKYVKIHEKLFIKRFRLKINQTKMADYFGFTRHEISDMELGYEKRLSVNSILQLRYIDVSDIKLTKVEKCIIQRRRKGLKQEQLADLMSVTRTWINHMETGRRNPERLIKYWSS